MRKQLLCLATAGLMLGCQSTPVVKTQYETIFLAPKDDWLVNCDISAPPAIDQYLSASVSEKERLLFEHAHSQMKNLALCNQRFQMLRDWKIQQTEAFKKQPFSSQ